MNTTPKGSAPDGSPRRNRQSTILVLDDESDIRAFAVAALQGLGYRVFEATDADAAARLLKNEAANIDLLLCDVVLTGSVSGPEFVHRARKRHPHLKVVFMSGYTANLYVQDKVPGFNDTLLNKPFGLADLVKAVRDALAG